MNSDHFLLICIGLWSIGVKPAFINYNLTRDALCHCVNTANAVLMLVDPQVSSHIDDRVREKLGRLKMEFVNDAFIAEAFAAQPVRPPNELRSGDTLQDMAVLIYTSGTTGLPKAAIVSWAKIIAAASFLGNWLGTRPDDILYTVRAVMVLRVSADVRKHKATIIQYVGETCRYLMAAPPEIDPITGENLDKKNNVRMAIGNGLRPDVWARFQERFGIESIGEFYAATEGFIGTWNFSRNDFSRGAIGRTGWLYGAFVGSKSAIVERDPETDLPWRDPKTGFCRQVPRGEIGEFLFLLPDNVKEVFQGYYNNEKANNSKIIRDVLKKGDAYFRSGDLIRWDPEGRIFFQDRIGDTFRWKSENVATTEVSAMMGLHPVVKEANVYGVSLPHHDGRAGCAAVTLRTSKIDTDVLRSLAAHARKVLPRYAVPIFLRFGEGLSAAVTCTNKQQKHNLRVEGVDPAKIGEDEIFWLRGDTYVKFENADWERMNAGQVKL
ncbi:acetyl-CoA synthetase-like protein [Xylariaceae sp. FL0255]|nr:acetyl-CoA synthetase-like protein [Xylariaceae sp. FL0255]